MDQLRRSDTSLAQLFAWQIELLAMDPEATNESIEALCAETRALLALVDEQRHGARGPR